MSLEQLKKMLADEAVTENVILLYGEEEYLRAHYRKKLTKALMPENMAELNFFSFSGKNYSLSDVDEAIEALPVFAERKLLVFSDSRIFMTDGRTGATAEYRSYWEGRLKNVPEGVYLIFSEDAVDKRSALYKYVSKNRMAVEFTYLSEEKMTNWIVGLFRTLGKDISPHDAKYLAEITEGGMLGIKQEAEKLAACTQGTQIGRKEIDEMVVPSAENRVFDMVDAMLNQNPELALMKLNELYSLPKSEKEDETRILGAVLYHVDKLVNTKLLTSQGYGQSEIASKLKIAPFQAGKFMRGCKKYRLEELQMLLSRCLQTDFYFKSDSMDKRVLLELLLAENS